MKSSSNVGLAAFASAMLVAAALGTAAAQEQAAVEDDAAGEISIQARSLESVLGREFRTSVEEDTGRIIDLLADRQGQVRAAVVEIGGFLGIGTRKIAVDWSALRFEPKEKQSVIFLDMGREELKRAPEYKPGETVVVRRAAQ